jgi:hypothetical protein
VLIRAERRLGLLTFLTRPRHRRCLSGRNEFTLRILSWTLALRLPANASAAQAQHIVKLMSDNLLKDFAKAGYTTKLLRPSDPRPDDGFLIAGVFTQVGADNRLRRAVIGSGQGAETLQLYVAAKDLAHFTPPLYQTDAADAAAAGGTKSGAMIEIGQNADVAKFSMEADVTDKDIKQTAQRISAKLVKRINAAVKSEDEQLNKYAKP